ncbi:uncharacterized protein LOC125189062 isoform X2 [Salvia hispanica]|uniref:uncharacterized protein LOC125189062 isoform X2 n=1 Tax=Salvia hispanica TaxID=49212 RepID=UPI00200970FA|nr:uncharacterized protein LOC125189062 isoform X2 [Salvia hispanica]
MASQRKRSKMLEPSSAAGDFRPPIQDRNKQPKIRTKSPEREQLASQPSPPSSVSPLMDAYKNPGEGLGQMSLFTPRYTGDDLSDIHGDEELRSLSRQLEFLQFRYQARVAHLMEMKNQEKTEMKNQEKTEMKNQEKTHVEGGLHFTVLWSTTKGTMHCHSFDELGLKDCSDRDLVISGFERKLEPNPFCVGFFCVGDTLFMAGGMINIRDEEEDKEKSEPTNCLWSAVPPTDGSLCESWTLCPATMKVKRSHPILVPLRDGRIFICGGTAEREGWAELYDPEKGELDAKNLTVSMGECPCPLTALDLYDPENGEDLPVPTPMSMCPCAISCFQWTDEVVMIYYHHLLYGRGMGCAVDCKPSLLSYNIAQDKWAIFAENIPPPLHGRGMGYRNLVYVGGDILFIIDYSCVWFVYDLSSKKKVGEVFVKARPRGRNVQVVEAFYTGNKDIKSSSWVFYVFMRMAGNRHCDLEYAKVEVVQGKGGDYISTVLMKGVLKIGSFSDIYIFAEKDRKGKEKIEMLET